MSGSRVRELIGDRPLSARSVLASALLGSDEARLTVANLVAVASLFGISDGAARTCLWRMVSNGELTGDDGSYALAGRLLERRQRVDEASRIDDVGGWDGTWELAIVSVERRTAADRLELRKAALALHLADFREGVWIRPDNLDPQRLSASRAVLDRQCTHFHGAATDITADKMRSLFALDGWADDARALIDAMEPALAGNGATTRPKASPTNSRCRSLWSAIFSSTRCCPPSSSKITGRAPHCATPIAFSTMPSRIG